LTLENTLYYEQIRNFNHELKERISDATSDLRQANTKLKKIDATKDDFISMASHQLRTPLTSVRGYIAMLIDGDFGHLSAKQKEVLGEAYISSERMAFIVSDFLDVSRLQTGHFELQKTPTLLSDVLNSEISQLMIAAELHNVNLIYDPPTNLPIINCDQNKLRQVMMNMIDNAIFYSHGADRVEVALYEKDHHVVFCVRDYGIGVPRAEQSRLFTKFYRASNARKIRPDGTGVGLFMARKIVTAHGGSLIFNSKENVGSTFGFRLPVNLKPEAVHAKPSLLGQQSQRSKPTDPRASLMTQGDDGLDNQKHHHRDHHHSDGDTP
jgi:signal transduction histidine kinase